MEVKDIESMEKDMDRYVLDEASVTSDRVLYVRFVKPFSGGDLEARFEIDVYERCLWDYKYKSVLGNIVNPEKYTVKEFELLKDLIVSQCRDEIAEKTGHFISLTRY